jgi:hypothetical protein
MKKLLVLAALGLPSLAMAQDKGLDKSYTVTINAAPAKAGTKAVAALEIKPGPGFHMNKEYPTSLKLTPPDGVTLEKQKLVAKDASKWEEAGGRFDVAYTAKQPGKKVVTGELSFAVCSANSCDPKKKAVSIEITAK